MMKHFAYFISVISTVIAYQLYKSNEEYKKQLAIACEDNGVLEKVIQQYEVRLHECKDLLKDFY